MKENFETALGAVLEHEGGFVDHPDDPGGATNRGVTLAVYERHFPGGGVDGLRAITDDALATIYRNDYWQACRCDDLPPGVDYVVFDQAVNSGPGRSVRWLQGALGAPLDGILGSETLALAKAAEPEAVLNRMCDERISFMKSLRGGRQWQIFGSGWARRVGAVKAGAESLAQGLPLSGPPSVAATFRTVRLGDSGLWVAELREALGFATGDQFDAETETAVQNYQAEHGLIVDGIAGRQVCRSLGLLP